MPEINKDEFPNNSRKAREQQKDETPRVSKVIHGSVIKKKTSFGHSILQAFTGDETKSVVDYVIWDVLIPAAKNTISEMVSTGIEMMLFGEAKGSRSRDKNKSYVSYGSYFKKDSDRQPERHERVSRNKYNFDEFILSTRGDAQEVLDGLLNQIDDYDVATVADLFDMIDVPGEFTDRKYGWDNLSRATVVRVRDGYILDLPKPQPLE